MSERLLRISTKRKHTSCYNKMSALRNATKQASTAAKQAAVPKALAMARAVARPFTAVASAQPARSAFCGQAPARKAAASRRCVSVRAQAGDGLKIDLRGTV